VRHSSITTMVTALIERCRSRDRSHDGRLPRCRYALMLVLCAATVSVVLFTSTIWRRDKVSAPYTLLTRSRHSVVPSPADVR
jgi:hypothetical protein